VLTEICPEAPKDDSTESQKTAYEKWCHSDEMTRCYILTSLSNVLQQKYQNIETAFDIMESLQEMFGHQSRQAKQASIRAIMNTRMKPTHL
jgi:hydroxymethylglutaryl-CoA reductase